MLVENIAAGVDAVIQRVVGFCGHVRFIGVIDRSFRQELRVVAFAVAARAVTGGIESTNAEMKTRHGMGRLRVRRKRRVELVMFFKALGCDIKRMVQYVLTSPEPDNSAFATPNFALC